MLEKCLLATIIATILASKMVNLLMLYVCSLFEFIDWPTKLECTISFFPILVLKNSSMLAIGPAKYRIDEVVISPYFHLLNVLLPI
jgi:fucose permease